MRNMQGPNFLIGSLSLFLSLLVSAPIAGKLHKAVFLLPQEKLVIS